jgi:nitrite reductase (NADH) small subunit
VSVTDSTIRPIILATPTNNDSKWVDVCSLDDIQSLGSRVVRVAGQADIAIFRCADDQVFAVVDRCPHKGGPLSQGMVFGKRVACPLHNWVIDLDSGQAVAPDVGCAQTRQVRVVDGRVQLAV